MDLVVNFNNQGVYFLELGILEQASACFRNAAEAVGCLRQRSRHANSDANSYDLIKGWSKPTKTGTLQEGCSMMFSRALMLVDHVFGGSQNERVKTPTFEEIDEFALVILYNSAVLNHTYSDSQGQISTATEAAYQGYEQVFTITEKLRGRIGMRFAFHLDVLRMVLFNNMGVLYHNNYGRFQDAVQCFKSARKQMDLLRQQLVGNSIMTIEEMKLLSMNKFMVPVTTAPVA